MLALAVALSSVLPAQGVRVSPALPRIPRGDVIDFRLAGNGGLLFRGNCSSQTRFDLYHAQIDGSVTQTRLTTGAQEVVDYVPTPDAQRVVFRAADGLYSAPLDGSEPPVLLATGGVAYFKISPDSQTVLYNRDLHDLVSVPILGGASVVLEQVGATSFVGADFTASADSSLALYRIKVGSEFELRSRPIGGGPATLLADTGTVADFKLSADGTEILFRSTSAQARTGLFRVPSAGGAPLELSPPLVRGATVLADYAFDQGRTRALFRATTGPNDDPAASSELWLAPLDGSVPAVKVNAALPSGEDVLDFRFDGAHVLYRATENGVTGLFGAPLDLSAPPVSLSAPMLAGMTVDDYAPSLDGTRAVFVSNRLDAALRRVWSVPIAGGSPIALDGRALPLDARLALDPLSGRVLYAASEGAAQGLFLVPADGSAPARRLDGPTVAGARVTSHLAADGRALYISSEALAETFELRSVPLDLPQPSVRLSRASEVFEWGGSVGTFGVSPDGTVAVLMTSDAAPVVHTTSLTRPVPVERSLPAAPGTTIDELVFAPDSNAVAYTLFTPASGTTTLHAASTRTDDPALRLDVSPVTGDAHDLVISPGSGRVFFLASSASHTAELFVSFLDGRFPPAVLNAPLVANARVRSFELASSGQRLLYLADQDQVNRTELYSVPSTGGPALRLNTDLGFGEDVLQARITPDASRAVFVADEVLNGIDNLYVVPLDGSAAPLALTDHASGAHSVALLAFTPDGAGALYRVRFPDGTAELRRVAVDGSGASILLDDDAFDPTELAFTPDGTRVVYRLVSSGSLRSARLDGGASALELDDLVSIDPPGHQVTGDSAHVVYRKNLQLWQAHVDGSTAPVRLGQSLGPIDRHELTRTGRILAGTATQLFVFETLTATPRFLAPLDSTRRFLATPEGRRVLSVNGELYLDYLTRPHLPR